MSSSDEFPVAMTHQVDGQSYEEFLAGLHHAMHNQHVAVNTATNPVAVALERLTLSQLTYVIQQYTVFPRHIVKLLYSARGIARDAGLREVDVELTRNIGEELGSESDGVAHAEMLLSGVEQALGIADVRQTRPSDSTSAFLDRMATLCGHRDDLAGVAGAVYALEASAVPELEIVWKLVERFTAIRGGRGSAEFGELERFFQLHLGVWEPGHEDGLRQVFREHLDAAAQRVAFDRSFSALLSAMDHWWQGLATEAAAR